MANTQRKMVAIDEESYRELIKAKGKLEMETGNRVSLADAIAATAVVVLAGYGLVKAVEALSQRKDRK